MKKIVLLFLIATIALSVNAQLPQEFGKFKRSVSNNQHIQNELIAKAIEPGVFVFSQSYQLEDSVGKFFGLSGNKEFGSDNSIGIKVKDGYIITDKGRVPWDYDSRFNKLKKRYNPVLFPTQYSEIGVETRYDSLFYNPDKLVTIYPNQLYGLKTDIFFNEGFTLSHKEGENEGFLVWFTIPEDFDFTNSSNVNLVVLRNDINIVKDRSKEYSISLPQNNEKVLGGIYVVPELSGIGKLDLSLSGIIVGENEDWKLICPFTQDNDIFDSEPINQNVEEEIELTPNEINK